MTNQSDAVPETSGLGDGRRDFVAPVTHLFGALGGLIIMILMFITVIDVTLRKLSGQGIPGALEVSEVLLVACAFLGMGAAQRVGAHVATTVLYSHLKPKARRFAAYSFGVVGALVILGMWVATGIEAMRSTSSGEYRFGLIEVPVWPARIVIVVGLTILIVEYFLALRREITSAKAPSADPVEESHVQL